MNKKLKIMNEKLESELQRKKLIVDKLLISLKKANKRYWEDIGKKNAELNECNKTIELLKNYNKEDAEFEKVLDDDINRKVSDHDSNIRQRMTSMNSIRPPVVRPQASRTFGGKLKKKSTKKKRSKQQKTKRRRKNKKN